MNIFKLFFSLLLIFSMTYPMENETYIAEKNNTLSLPNTPQEPALSPETEHICFMCSHSEKFPYDDVQTIWDSFFAEEK